MKNLVLALLSLCLVSVGQATMLADFETPGVFDGYIAIGSPLSTLATSTTVGAVTSGSQCLRVQHNPTNFWPIRWNAPAVPARLGKLRMDVTCFAAEWPASPWTRFNQKIAVQSNGAGGGWAEYETSAANWTNRVTGGSAPVDWGGWDGDMFRTVTIDISNYNLTGATWFSITMSFNCGTAGPYYIDNVHFVPEPHNPSPAHNGIAVIGANTTLSWNNAKSGLNWVKVWFKTTPVENPNDPNTILNQTTYKTLLGPSPIATLTNPGDSSSIAMPALTSGVSYTWAIERDPNDNVPVLFWKFTASTNNPPVANAGPDQYRWLAQPLTITLNGAGSTDDGRIRALTYAWAQTAGATATINSPAAAITTVTLPSGMANTTETGAAAPYVFELTVDDGQFTNSDTVRVTVNSDSCKASIEAGGYYFYGDIAGPSGSGGANRDCTVNLLDLAELSLNWLACSNMFAPCN